MHIEVRDKWPQLLCTATNIVLGTFLIWTPSTTNYIWKWWDIHEKLIKIITTSICYLKSKVDNKNDMAALAFWARYCSTRWPSEIGPTDENDAEIFCFSWYFLLEIRSLRPTGEGQCNGGSGDRVCIFHVSNVLPISQEVNGKKKST